MENIHAASDLVKTEEQPRRSLLKVLENHEIRGVRQTQGEYARPH